MRIIISPAKKMRVETDHFPVAGLPPFLDRSQRLKAALQGMTYEQLKSLWQCSDRLAHLNMERLEAMDLRRGLTPAILAYEGIQYQYMAPQVFTHEEICYVQAHLRILSGFYGLLRPLDGVVPYRLEMQATLKIDGCRDLYDFWGRSLADSLGKETDCIIDLASKEYSRAVSRHLAKEIKMITCVFAEEKQGRLIEKGTLCKMARGAMVRFMAESRAGSPEDLKAFSELNFRFDPEHSKQDTYVFIRS